VSALRELSPHAVDAFAVIDAGRAAKIESDMKQARDNAQAVKTPPVNKRGRR